MRRKALCFLVLLSLLVLIVPEVAAETPSNLPRHLLERKVFIHRARPDRPGNTKPTGCYSDTFARWLQENVAYAVNPADSGLPEADVRTLTHVSAEEWDSGAWSRWGEVSFPIFSDEGPTITTRGPADIIAGLDGVNTVVWGTLDPGTIAVTYIWYYRMGRPSRSPIVEFDIIFNTYYAWSTDGSSSSMDLQNIATHELGHAVGMDDLYLTKAVNETMYGYSTYGETSKRDLFCGDQKGVTALYK